jgi:gliding motility-associated-like protein
LRNLIIVISLVLLSHYQNFAQSPSTCFEIESIFVDACGSPEQDNEMMRFRIGPGNLNVSALVITWYSNAWLGICQNATSAQKTAAFNRTIMGCGYLKEPVGGVLPSGSQVLLITSTAVDTLANSFATLNDTLIVIYLCPGASSGHFRNYNSTPLIRTTIVTFTGVGGCSDTAVYDPHELVNSLGGYGGGSSIENGATVNFSWSNVPTYVNNGCTAPFIPLNAYINQNDTTICAGQAVGIKAVLEGTSNISWNVDAGMGSFNRTDSISVIFTPSSSATYPINVYLKSFTPCDTIRDTLFINKYMDPTSVMNDTSHCLRDTLSLFAAGATTYSWSASSGYISCSSCASPRVYSTSNASYYVTITFGASCVRLDTVDISTLAQDSVNIAQSDTSICNGNTFQLFGSSNSGYIWSGSPSLSCTSCTSPALPISATTVIVLSSTGVCQSKDSIRITKVDYDIYTISNDTTICLGQTALIESFPFISIYWSNAASIGMGCSLCSSTTIAPSDSVEVYAISTGYCPSLDTMQVHVEQYPSISVFASDSIICNGEIINLSATGASLINWSSPSGTSSLTCTSCPNPNASPTSSILYIAQNVGRCISRDSVSIQVRDYPILTVSNDTTICTGDSLQLFALGDTAFIWNSPAGTSTLSCTNCASPMANPLSNIVYTVRTNGFCVSVDTVNVSVLSSANIIASNDTTICAGQSIGLNVSGASTYAWSSPSGSGSLSCNLCSNPVANPMSNIIYYVSSTGISCVSSDTVNVSVVPTTKLNAGSDEFICAGAQVNLSVIGATTYAWTSSSSPSYLSCASCSNPIASPISTINYFVSSTDNCVLPDTIKVFVTPIQKIDLGADTFLCIGQELLLIPSNGVYYQWSTLPATSFTCDGCNSINVISSVDITYVVNDTASCVIGDTIAINVFPNPTVNAGLDVEILSGTSTILNASGAIDYIWTPDLGLTNVNTATPQASPLLATNYVVEGTDINGCKDVDTVLVTVKSALCPIAIPTGFTPNNDGVNDIFRVISRCTIQNFNLLIINRWGELVFESKDQSTGWDGVYKDREQQINTYVYYITGIFSNGEKVNLTGTITLLR